MLTTIERRQKIVLMTEENGKVNVKDLAKTFDISEVSIRHDLNELGKRGLVVRSRGGAIACDKLVKELSVKDKHNENYAVKVLLAKAVANLVDDDSTFTSDDFIITVDTSLGDGNNSFRIPTYFGETYNYNVDCNNDGINEATGQTGNYTCNYSSSYHGKIIISRNDGGALGTS